MFSFWEVVVSNSLVICVLAVGILLASRLWKNSAALHTLWLLLVVKLFLPPLFVTELAVGVRMLTTDGETAADRGIGVEPLQILPTSNGNSSEATQLVERAIPNIAVPNATVSVQATTILESIPWTNVFGLIWVTGSVLVATSYTRRILGFHRSLREAEPPTAPTIDLVASLAERMSLIRAPRVLMTPLRVTPLVWSFGRRPVIVLPTELFSRLDRSARESILIHELAHVRRRDFLIRFVEVIATTAFWWHPVIWFACARMRELEEQCCDQAVVNSAPQRARNYASTLVDTLDFLAVSPPRRAPLATAIHCSGFLGRRIQMLQEPRAYRLTSANLAIILAMAIVPLATAFVANAQEKGSDGADAPKITGKVTNEVGEPLANVRIRASVPAADMRFVNEGIYETTSDKDGHYELVLQGLAVNASVSIDAMAPGYQRLSGQLQMFNGKVDREVGPGQDAEASFALKPGIYVKGVVVNEGGEPLANVSVGANADTYRVIDGKERPVSSGGVERTISREDGTFEVFNYLREPLSDEGAPEKGAIHFGRADYISAQIDDIYVLSEKERINLRIVLPTGRKASGVVLDSDGQPVSNVMVEVLDTNDKDRDKACLTDGEGKFKLVGLIERPAIFRVHAMPLRQKVTMPVSLDHDYEDLEIRLEPVSISQEPDSVEVLGMKLADITPELQSRYDLYHEKGALILDPGTDFARLEIGELREGYYFWMVGEKPIGSLREFVEQLLAEADKPEMAEHGIRVVYTFRDPRMVGTNTQHIKLTDTDVAQLRKVLASLSK